MIKKIIKNKYQIIELIVIFIITLLFNILCNSSNCDEIYNYGFSYNIVSGLIPYKDFNMVITPLYPYLGAIFLSIFGKNLIIYHIFNALICTTIFSYMKKITPKSYYIIYAIFLFFSLPNYSLFCILLLYIILSLEDKKANDYLIGFFLGLTFLTKQNIGIYLCIPTLFTKNISKIIKRIIGFFIPIIFLLIYLLTTNTLQSFINYTFLGVKSFAKENSIINTSFLLINIISIIYLIYHYIKTKDIKDIYLIAFQGMSIPIADPYHIMISLIPTFTYLLKPLHLSKKVITIGFILFLITIFSYNIIQIQNKIFSFPNQTTIYKYRKIDYKEAIAIKDIANYIKKTSQNHKIYIFNTYAYLLKLEANLPINKYDLINNGNMGYNGEQIIIEEINTTCKEEKCLFILNKKEIGNKKTQTNQTVLTYITNTYKEKGKIQNLSILTNY